MMRSRFGLAAAIALSAAAAGMGASVNVVDARTHMSEAKGGSVSKTIRTGDGSFSRGILRQAFGGMGYGSRGGQRRRGPGWTTAHVQRMARKRRNVSRNRKAHRG